MERVEEGSQMRDAAMSLSEQLVGGVSLGGDRVSRAISIAPSRDLALSMAGPTRDFASISIAIAEQHANDGIPKMEQDAKGWMASVLGEPMPDGPLQPLLKDGVRLCSLMNAIEPGICSKPSETTVPFKQMENINMYLTACKHYGVPTHDSFQSSTRAPPPPPLNRLYARQPPCVWPAADVYVFIHLAPATPQPSRCTKTSTFRRCSTTSSPCRASPTRRALMAPPSDQS